ncbi:MAG: ATP-binding protein [Taibaiella sp.]|nr:ATP-binding protein [Taibaiella sp.]
MKKIVVIGPESTGKSTLSEALANALGTLWVPEYARTYLDTLKRKYTQADLLTIAEGQLSTEDKYTLSAEKLLICDTDLNVIKVWSEYKYNGCHAAILRHIAARRYDLYLLTGIDIPWQNDPQREHPEPAMRSYFYNIYLDVVQNSGVPWVAIDGTPEERVQKSLLSVQQFMQ